MFVTLSRHAVAILLALAVVAGMVFAFRPAMGGDAPAKGIPKLDTAEREAIVEGIYQVLKSERKKDSPNEVDPKHWGEAISRLKPLRVYFDRGNVAIVLTEKAGVEEGVYVVPFISSYLPQVGEQFALLTTLSTKEDKSLGTLHHFKKHPKAK